MKIKGNGSIRPIKNNKGEKVKNSWQLVLSVGFDPITGKRRQLTRRFHGNKTEAKRALENFRREIEFGLKIDADKTTFGEYAAEWIEDLEKSKKLKPATIDRYKQTLEHLNGCIEHVPLGDIDAPTVRRLHNKLIEKGYSQHALSKAAFMLKRILKQAVNDDVLLRNPCEKVDIPPQPKSTAGTSLDDTEAARLVRKLGELESKEYPLADYKQQKMTANASHCMAIKLILATGLRHGEVLGLSWRDIDLANSTLHVEHNLDRMTNDLSTPKTECSKRDIILDENTVLDLAKWMAKQKTFLNHLGIEQGSDTPVITSEAGTRMDNNNLSRWWRKFREDNGFGTLRIHDLRHSHASILVRHGVNAKAVSERLGHSDVGTTLRIYTHTRREDDEKAAETIGAAMRMTETASSC